MEKFSKKKKTLKKSWIPLKFKTIFILRKYIWNYIYQVSSRIKYNKLIYIGNHQKINMYIIKINFEKIPVKISNKMIINLKSSKFNYRK